MTKIEELEQKLNECQKALAELKESKKEKWKPKQGEKYWLVDCCGKADFGFWNNDCIDIWRYNTMPLFKEKRECEKYKRFMDTVKEKSYEFSKEEWENQDINKYTIFYRFQDKEWNIGYDWSVKFFGKIYFKTKEDAQYIIDNFKEELMEYWL